MLYGRTIRLIGVMLRKLKILFLDLYPDNDITKDASYSGLRTIEMTMGLKTRTFTMFGRNIVTLLDGLLANVVRFGRFLDPRMLFFGLLSISKGGDKIRGLRTFADYRRDCTFKIKDAFGSTMTLNLDLGMMITITLEIA